MKLCPVPKISLVLDAAGIFCQDMEQKPQRHTRLTGIIRKSVDQEFGPIQLVLQTLKLFPFFILSTWLTLVVNTF